MPILFGINIYRAATQSITTDEAFTFLRSVLVPIPKLWQAFDANDHVLHTLLCKASVAMFGAGEFTLRIPALLGGVLLLWMCLRLCLLLFGGTWYMLIAFLTLALNPFLLDYCSIARGYGMATALLLVSLDQLLRYQSAPYALWRLYAAGISLALAAAANLTAVIPGTALVLMFAGIHLGEPIYQKNWARLRVRAANLADHMIVPGIVITVAMLLGPLSHAHSDTFYVGARNLRESITSFVYAIFWRPRNPFEFTPLHRLIEDTAIALAPFFVAAVLLGGMILSLRDRRRMLLTGVCSLSILILIGLHYTAGVPYPERRTGLYLVPLLTLLAASVFQPAKALGGTVAAIFLAQFLLSWNVRFYDEWLIDSGNRDLALFLRGHPPAAGRRLKLGATFPLQYGTGFYRHLYGMEWLDLSAAHNGPDGVYDLYFLAEKDHQVVEKRKLRVIYRHPFSKVEIAIAP